MKKFKVKCEKTMKVLKLQQLAQALTKIRFVKSKSSLQKMYEAIPLLHNNQSFIAELNKKVKSFV